VSSERQRVSDVLYQLTRARNLDGAELNSASRRRHALAGPVNRLLTQLYGTPWTRRPMRIELNAGACDRNACAFDLNAFAFVLYGVAPCRRSLRFSLAR